MYDWLKTLSENESFRNCLPITEKKEDAQAYMEIALRFIVYRYIDKISIGRYVDLNDLLTDAMKNIFTNLPFALVEEKRLFEDVFLLLEETLEENSFKKYNIKKKRYEGPFSLSIFEVIATGVSFQNLQKRGELKAKIKEISESLQGDNYFLENTKYGTRSIDRFKILVDYGKKLFSV